MKIKILNQRRPGHDLERIRRLYALAEGGPDWRKLVGEWLPKREVEPADVYTERKGLATYVNHAGGVLDLLAAMLFGEAPKIEGLPAGDYYEQLINDCDGAGTPWRRWWREAFADVLRGGRCWVWANLPPAGEVEPATRADEEALGRLDAFLVKVTAQQALDWGTDSRGALRWLLWLDVLEERATVEDKRGKVWRWTYVDDVQIRRWEWSPPEGSPKTEPDDDDLAKELPPIAHGAGRLPLVEVALPPALWLMHRVEDATLAALRARNEHTWALHQGANELLVLSRKWDDQAPELGHGHYLQIGPEESAEYLAPTGVAFQYLAADVEATREDLYRTLQAMALAADSDSQAARLSGESKAQDWQATQILLAAYQDQIVSSMQAAAELIVEVRGDTADEDGVNVSGLDGWQSEDLQAFLLAVTQASEASRMSPTFRRTVAKRQAERILQDEVSPEDMETIRAEIDAAPDLEEGPEAFGFGGAPGPGQQQPQPPEKKKGKAPGEEKPGGEG
jgi:hypothetical protein